MLKSYVIVMFFDQCDIQDKEKWEEQSVESGHHSPDYPLLQFEYDNIFDDICL